MANFIVKFEGSSCSDDFNQKRPNLLNYNINSLKYKFVLCLLKEDRRNRSFSVYNNIKKVF